MRRFAAALLTGALAVSSLAFTNHPDDFEYVPNFVQQDAFFHRSTTPVGNVDAVALGEHVTWDAEAPTLPVPSAYAMNNLVVLVEDNHQPRDFFTATGTFTGDLDTLAVDLYIEHAALNLCGLSLSFELTVDGVTLLSQDFTGSNGISFEPVDETTAVVQFALTNIFAQMEDYEEFGTGIEAHGGDDVVREVTLNVQNFYLCNEFVALYDGVDHPSSIKANFNSFVHTDIDVQNPPPPIEAA